MMVLFRVVLWSVLPLLTVFCGPDHCSVPESNSSSQSASPLLESLQCYNDYKTYVHCKWRKHRNTPLQLWFKTDDNREFCEPYSPLVQDEPGIVQCRYETYAFAIGIKHTVFFLKNETLSACSSALHKPLDLSQHLRVHPPVDLSTQDAGDGGRWLHWSSPYPSSSSLNKNLTYQLSYRADEQDSWTTEDATTTSMKLEKHSLLPGHRYEARVRARASVGQWSDWSPVVTWKTEEDTGQVPRLHCVLDAENEVMCSWDVSTELAHFITYQLVCRQTRTASPKTCCVNPTVSADPSGTMLRYSCSLTVPDPAHLLLELQPTHSAKTFAVHQHIHPKPPQQVTVKEKGNNWIVEWTEPSTASKLKLEYQVSYCRTQDQVCSDLLNVSMGSTSLTIPGKSLAMSQHHQVKVRSLVRPGEGSRYEGIPSEWTDPVGWNTHAATSSFSTLKYVLISVLVVIVIFILYHIPACQRELILWVDSIPSPGKSKILSEIKFDTSWTIMQSEDTCKVLHFDTISTCSSNVSLWPTTDTNVERLDTDEGFWNGDSLPAGRVNGSDTSSMSFSGPYILCQTSEAKSGDVKCEEKEKDEKALNDSPSPVSFSLHGKGYVCLPNHSASRSTQDLVSYSDASTNTHWHGRAKQDQQCPDTTPWPDKTDNQPGLSEDTGRDQPPPYTSGPFTPWPQGGIIQASGYCHLPQP